VNVLRQLARATIPERWRQRVRAARRRRALRRALQRYAQTLTLDEPLLKDLLYGWANVGWTVQREYTEAFLQRARELDGPILECGSGLSTLLLGITVKARGGRVWSLEHHPQWAARVQRALADNGIDNVDLCVSDLRDYGDYDWYDPPLDRMPRDFRLVVCDGPPHTTRGGRYGMLPVMRAHLAPGAVVLLDDIVRDEEKSIAARWAQSMGTEYEIIGSRQPFACIVVPEAADRWR
jgi:predicted O-methyltransferase YrrM